MALELVKAQRNKAFLKLGVSAPSGGGKTLSSLLFAYGMLTGMYPEKTPEFRWSKIAIIDTENGSGQMYVGRHVGSLTIGQYNAVSILKPFTAEKYIEAIELCEDANMDFCIIDSTTHLWSAEGGLLEQQSAAARRSGNSYTAWRDITPMHNKFVQTMLQSQMHVIATMRAKQEYIITEDNSSHKKSVKKMGLEPEQRKGMEYEFTTFLEIDAEHTAFGSKDRTGIFDQKYFVITPEHGFEMYKWLSEGTNAEKEVIAISELTQANSEEGKKTVKEEIISMCSALGGQNNSELMELLHKYNPKGNPNGINDSEKLIELRLALKDMIEISKIKQ